MNRGRLVNVKENWMGLWFGWDEMRWDEMEGSIKTKSSTVHPILEWDEIGFGLDLNFRAVKQTLILSF